MGFALPVFLFESIPEALVLMSLGLALYGQRLKGKMVRLIIVAVVFAAFNSITREFITSYHYRTLLNISIMVLLIIAVLRINPLQALFAALTSSLIFMIFEVILVFLLTTFTDYTASEILANVWLRIFLPWIYILPTGVFAFYLSNIGYSVLSIGDVFIMKDYKRHSKIYLAVLFLFFAVVLGLMNAGLVGEESSFSFKISPYGVMTLSFLLLLDIFFIFLVIKRLFKASEKEALIEAQNIYLRNMEDLLTTLRAQRHDFINHLEVISTLHAEGEYAEESKYLDKMLGDIQKVNSLIRINNPPLSALLKTKQAVAETCGITMEVEVDCSLDRLPMDSFTLVKILGNVLDNALEELERVEDKSLEVSFECYLDRYVIHIFNSGSTISEDNKEMIFEKGFTTKGEEHQGLGLCIVKELIEQHGGEIKVRSNNKSGTVFIITLPMKQK